MNIGENIASIRKSKNLKQEELASLINVSPKTISSYETNRSIPNIEMLILLAKALDTSIENILNLNNENSEEIKKIYEKNDLKNNIIKIIILSIIFIIPIIYFIYSAYISISSLAASIINDMPIIDATKITFNLFLTFAWEYFIYLILLLVNYILYKKKHFKILLIINIILFGLIAIDIIPILQNHNYDILIFLINVIEGFILAYNLKRQCK